METVIPVINSYTDIKTSGKTGLITNQNIRHRFTNLELNINHLQTLANDRLSVHQLRIDDIAVNEINFVRLISIDFPEFRADEEPANNYNLLLANQKNRNLLAIKLHFTLNLIKVRKELMAEIENLITLLEDEIEGFNN